MMKGTVTATFIWILAVSPMVFFAWKLKARSFIIFSGLVGVFSLFILISVYFYGIGICENLTNSLNGSIYVYSKNISVTKGDLVAFRWHGGATYPAGTIFIKRVVGISGDHVYVDGRKVWVNDVYIGYAKPFSKAGIPLDVIASGEIPDGQFFVATPMADSLDSRYALTGFIKSTELLGRAYEVF